MQNHKILIENIMTNYYKYQWNSEFVVIFLHWRGRNWLDWKFQTQQLEKSQISYFALDFPWFGNTETPKFPRNVEKYSEFVLKFMKKVGVIDNDELKMENWKKLCETSWKNFVELREPKKSEIWNFWQKKDLSTRLDFHKTGSVEMTEEKKPKIWDFWQKIILIWHSFGGRIAFQLSARHPKLFHKIILFAPWWVEKTIWQVRKCFLKVWKFIFDLPWFGSIWNIIKKKIWSDDYKVLNWTMKESFKLIVNQDLSSLFSSIQTPIQIHRWKNDNQIYERQIDIIQKHISNIQIFKYENIDHYIHQKISILKFI